MLALLLLLAAAPVRAERGTATLTNSDGTTLVVTPSTRPAPAAFHGPPLASGAALPTLPTLDDPRAPLAERKKRAETILLVSALSAFALALWARRFKS